MMGNNYQLGHYSYYGRMNLPDPIRPLTEDILKEAEMFGDKLLKESESRMKRYIADAKREVIKEIRLVKDSIKQLREETRKLDTEE